jgi:hypothetical protein
MFEDTTSAPEVNVGQPEPETVGSEPTVEDLHPKVEDKKLPDTVPYNRLSKEVAKRKALEKELAELRSQLVEDEDMSSADVDDMPDVKKLAAELEGIKKKEQMAELNKRFETHYQKAMENMPEYKDVANIEVIRQLAFNPSNANKTYKQLLEETYGNVLSGRRTIETTTPRGGAKDSKLDIERARKDASYRHEVLADPDLRRQYNEGLADRIFR